MVKNSPQITQIITDILSADYQSNGSLLCDNLCNLW